MLNQSYAAQPILEKPKPRHLLAALVAMALSGLFHFWVIDHIPPLPIGQPPDLKGLESQVPIVLGEVSPDVLKRLERPERFRPEDPRAIKDIAEELKEFTTALDEVLPDDLLLDDEPELAGDDAALADASPPEERAAWSARQEIVQINESLFNDEVSTLPRRYVSGEGRAGKAPDISLPVDLAMVDLGAESKVAPAAPSNIEDLISKSALIGPPMLGDDPLGPPSVDLDKPLNLFDETLEEITDIKPLEELLDLNIHTFKDAADHHTYFRIDIRRHGNENLPVVPKDVLFILDSSYSMTQSKLELCKQGVKKWIMRLNPDDQFNIIAFRDEVIWCFEEWKRLDPVSKTMGFYFLERLKARGKTDVFASLQPLLSLNSDPHRPVISVLITDGRPTMGLVDGSDIIQTFSRANNGKVSVFALGGGKKVNRFLLDMLSYSNRGDSNVVEAKENLPSAIDYWGVQLDQPVLTSLQYRFAGLEESEIYPRTLTHLFLNRSLVILGRVPDLSQDVAFQIIGQSAGKEHDMVFKMEFAKARQGAPDIRTQWAWHKVHHLIGEHILTKDPRIIRQLNELSKKYQIVIPYSSDIAPRN